MQNQLFNQGVALLLAFSLAGCAGMSHREKNTALGATAGGVAGAVLGGGVLGTAAGAAVGGVLGHELGGDGNKRDSGKRKR